MSRPRLPSPKCTANRRGLAVSLLALHLCPPSLAAVDDATAKWILNVLDGWTETCRVDLHIAERPLPWMIFYDEDYAWHINSDRRLLPPYKKLARTVHFNQRTYDVLEVVNEGRIWVPGRAPVPIAPKAISMLYAEDTKPFFVMGTPTFQQRAMKASETREFRDFLIGLALHELAHTRQLPQVVQRIKRLQGLHHYPDSVDDNIIQTAFESNSDFRKMYDDEAKQLSKAVLASDVAGARAEAAEALRMIERRRERFFAGKYEGWSEMEDVFLALEGSAMWVQLQSALRLAPKGQPWLATLTVLAQRTDAWSQAEGLGLFLLINRFSPGWQAKFFGQVVPSPVETLRQAIAPAVH